MTRNRALILSASLLLFVSSVTLLIAEYSLRHFGYAPKPATKLSHLEGSWAALDSRFGWVNRAGGYPSFEPGKKIMNFEIDHSRRVVGNAKEGMPKLLFVGCSFTQGYGIEDQQTFASIIDNELPNMKVLNFGTGGYGTYQAFLRMRKELEERSDIGYVVYPFVDHHLARNVAYESWVKALELMDGSNFVPPSVRMRANEIKEFPGHIEKVWFLEMHSALVHLIHNDWILVRHEVLPEEQVSVTRAIIKEMASLAKNKGVPFLVVGLMYPDQNLITKVVDNDIRFVDCRLPGGLSPEMKVGGVGHPNEAAHKAWAAYIMQSL